MLCCNVEEKSDVGSVLANGKTVLLVILVSVYNLIILSLMCYVVM